MLLAHRLRTTATVAISLGIIVALAYWGGTTRPGPLFSLGIAVLASLVLAFGLLVAWLFRGPAQTSSGATTASARLTLSALALGGATAFTLGFFWDELWHRRYKGFGDDFLWPPHLLIYASIGLFATFAAGGLIFTVRGRSGTFRERLRTEPHISLVTLAATFLMVSLPSDELWHRVYGLDITAWSLPHITLAGGVVLITLVSAGLAASVVRRSGAWLPLSSTEVPHWISALLIAIGTVILVQFGTTEWEGITTLHPEGGAFRNAFWQRPVWLYPVVVTSVALFCGNFALHTLKRFGAATCIALLVFLFRVSSLYMLGTSAEQALLTYTAQLCLIAPAISLDLWYMLRSRQMRPIDLYLGNGLASAALLIVGLPLIDRLLLYPPIMTSTVPSMVVMSLILGQFAGWAGARFGGWLIQLDPTPSSTQLSRRSAILMILGPSALFTLVASIMILGQPPQG